MHLACLPPKIHQCLFLLYYDIGLKPISRKSDDPCVSVKNIRTNRRKTLSLHVSFDHFKRSSLYSCLRHHPPVRIRAVSTSYTVRWITVDYQPNSSVILRIHCLKRNGCSFEHYDTISYVKLGEEIPSLYVE